MISTGKLCFGIGSCLKNTSSISLLSFINISFSWSSKYCSKGSLGGTAISKTNNFILTRQFFFTTLFTKFREIKLMNHIIQANSNNILFAVYLSINSVQEGSTKYNGTKAILWGTENKKISRIFSFPTQGFNISNNPNW